MPNTATYPIAAEFSGIAASSSPPITPPLGLPDHQGSSEHNPFFFFAAPPAGIGAVKSAESTLRPGARRTPLVLRILIALATAFGTMVVMGFLAQTGARGHV